MSLAPAKTSPSCMILHLLEQDVKQGASKTTPFQAELGSLRVSLVTRMVKPKQMKGKMGQL